MSAQIAHRRQTRAKLGLLQDPLELLQAQLLFNNSIFILCPFSQKMLKCGILTQKMNMDIGHSGRF